LSSPSHLNAPAADAIEIDRVSVRFEGRKGDLVVDALRDVCLSIAPGSFVSLVGPSGSGKSTLLRVLAGILAPTQGLVRIGDRVVTGPSRSVGLMFQTSLLFPWRTALDNVLLSEDVRGANRQQSRPRALELLSEVGLDGFADALPRELSGGMRQRVALARTLMADPSVLLMDEPFGALDEFTRERLDLSLLALWERDRKTVVFVTHNIQEAVLLSDRVVALGTRPGRILEVVDVPLDRPRHPLQMRTSAFVDLVFTLRALLSTDA
jgi:NitT/TauT family transport system ATP-binding protein